MCMWHGEEKAGEGEIEELTCVCVNVGEVIEGDMLNRYMLTAAEYLLHCLEFCNLSQHTSISPSYHQHLGRWGGGKEGTREKGGR